LIMKIMGRTVLSMELQPRRKETNGKYLGKGQKEGTDSKFTNESLANILLEIGEIIIFQTSQLPLNQSMTNQ
jgi:hypothetical protein